jgi:ribonuclease E
LRPSLDEASHVICPRCEGRGTIRNIESLALSVLRLIQEEAMKDKTGRVIAQLPVKVATFLLNEKREAIRAFEQRHRVGILLIPNQSLETPHFKLSRLRVEELSETQRLSYTLAEDYEEQYEAQVNAALRETIEEPAVKSVAPTSPAPLPPSPGPKPEVNASFFRWLWGNLFGQPQQPAVREERSGRSNAKPAKPERQRRERPGRRSETASVTEAPAIQPIAAPVQTEAAPILIAPPPEEAPLEPKQIPESVATPIPELEESTATAESEEETSGRSRRGRRGGRRRKRSEAPADTVPTAESAPSSDTSTESEGHLTVDETAAPTISEKSTGPQRRIRSGRPRLPRETLTAQTASKAMAEPPALLDDELLAPPLTRLEYPTVEEEVEEPKAANYSEPETPVQPVDQAQAPCVESAHSANESPQSVEPAFAEAETAVGIDVETIQVPIMLEEIVPEADETAPATEVFEADIQATEIEAEIIVSEEALVNESPTASEAAVEEVEKMIPATEPSTDEPVIEPSEASEPDESPPARGDAA